MRVRRCCSIDPAAPRFAPMMAPRRIAVEGQDMQDTPGHLQAQLIGLSSLIHLIKRARHAARAQELAFVMVNESHALIPYRQAVLWRADGRIVAMSGNAVVEPNAPFALWLKRAFARLDRVGA